VRAVGVLIRGDNMGERAGYRIRIGDKTSMICRRQWYLGGGSEELESLIMEVAQELMDTNASFSDAIGSGAVALRNDLDMSRMFPALVRVVCTTGFDSIEEDVRCDISDHGLFEIEIITWNE